jgi:pyruvate-formate lyase-activating enzyme
VSRQLLDAELLDYVAVDCKTLPERYYPELCAEPDVAVALRRTLALLHDADLPYEVRTTCAEPFIGAREIEELAALLSVLSLKPAKDVSWFLQKANLTSVMRAKGLAPVHTEYMERLAGLVGARIR